MNFGQHRLPDFIIGGAARSGTTWTHSLCGAHPEIAIVSPPRPEPKFFHMDELYERGLTYYAETWFDALPQRRVLGEKSAPYLVNPDCAERIRLSLPEVRLVFLLRNPVDRAYSNYRWSRQNGMESESFAQALALEGERERNADAHARFVRPFAYFERGLYAEQLERYFVRFPREQILVLRSEDIAVRPRDVAARLQRFLGVKEIPTLAEDLGKVNHSERPVPGEFPATLRAELAGRYAEPNRRLYDLLGPDFEKWTEPQARATA